MGRVQVSVRPSGDRTGSGCFTSSMRTLPGLKRKPTGSTTLTNTPPGAAPGPGFATRTSNCRWSPIEITSRLARIEMKPEFPVSASSGTSRENVGPADNTKGAPREPGPSAKGAPGNACRFTFGTTDGYRQLAGGNT